MLERLLLLEIGGLRTRGRAHPMGGVKPTPLSTAENVGSRAAVDSSRMPMVAIVWRKGNSQRLAPEGGPRTQHTYSSGIAAGSSGYKLHIELHMGVKGIGRSGMSDRD